MVKRNCKWAPTVFVLLCLGGAVLAPVVLAEPISALGPAPTLAEIEACVSRNLPNAAGVVDFRVEAFDRTGGATTSRAEIRWRKDQDALQQVVLRVSEPSKTAGTALLIIDRASDQPEFFVRLPELSRVKRVRSKRLRGPVLGTDFSYEDLDRMRTPLDRTDLRLVGTAEVGGRSVWQLETRPGASGARSEYSRVLTSVDQAHCLPVQVDLFSGGAQSGAGDNGDEGERLHKRLRVPAEEIRPVDGRPFPHMFVMEDLRRETHTVVRVERFRRRDDLPADQFTKQALKASAPTAPVP